MRAKWNYTHGVTNVWHIPALHGSERLKIEGGKALHYNQKPREIIDYLLHSSTDEGDIVWDPFAGLATTGICCLESGRRCYCAEISDEVYINAMCRLQNSLTEQHRKDGDVG